MESFNHTSAIILAAGKSERMGEHKALLKFSGEETFISKITETYLLAGIEQVIVVVNSQLFKLISESNLTLSKKVLLVINDKPELGRFNSLQTGIKQLKPGNFCFFQNIDNPITSVELLKAMSKYKDEADVIIPVFQNRPGHPVLFNPYVSAEILKKIDSETRIDYFFKKYNVLNIETANSNILLNINSPEDYLAVLRPKHE